MARNRWRIENRPPRAAGLVVIDVCLFLWQIRIVFNVAEPTIRREPEVKPRLQPSILLTLDNPVIEVVDCIRVALTQGKA